MGLLQLNPIRPLQWTSLFLLVLSFILYICALALPNYLSVDDVSVGAWQYCIGSDCTSIDNHCTDVGFTDSECQEFQAFRAFLVLSFVVSFFTVVIAFTVAIVIDQWTLSKTLNVAVMVLGWTCTVLSLISWALATDLTSADSSYRGAAFGVLISAWVFQLISMILWTVSIYREPSPNSIAPAAGTKPDIPSFNPSVAAYTGPNQTFSTSFTNGGISANNSIDAHNVHNAVVMDNISPSPAGVVAI